MEQPPEDADPGQAVARSQPGPSAAAIRTLLATAYAADPLMHWLFAGVEEPVHACAAWLNLFVERYLSSGRVHQVATEGTPTEPHAYLHFLAVDPGSQRQGIGSRLLVAAGPE